MTDQASVAEEDGTSQKTKYWPATFHERGVVGPFTTPLLAFSRIRVQDSDRFELLVPGMSGGTGTYVVGWKSIPEVFRLSIHDRALHEKILENKADSPRSVRRCAQDIAISGLAGADAQEAARKARESDLADRQATNLSLIAHTVADLTSGETVLTLEELGTAAGKRKALDTLERIAARLGKSAEQIYLDIEDWSDLVTPLGIPRMQRACRLRDLVRQIDRFRVKISEWGSGTGADSEAVASLTEEVAVVTLSVARDLFAALDSHIADPASTLKTWDATSEIVRGQVERLCWVLDGWEHVLAMWDGVADSKLHEQARALGEMARMLPLVPKSELDQISGHEWGKLEDSLRSHARQALGEKSDESDLELTLRVEKRRAAAL